MLRLHGFNITAKANTSGSRLETLSTGTKLLDAWRDEKGRRANYVPLNIWMENKGYKKMDEIKYLEFWNENTKEEGVYLIAINYNERNGGGGHAAILQRFKDNTLKYIDPQISNYRYNTTAKKAKAELHNFARSLTEKPSHSRGIIRIDDKFFYTKAWRDIFNF